MTAVQWIRFLPFALLALVLLGWSLIVILQTPRRSWDWLNVALASVGIVAAVYIGSLALDFSPADPGVFGGEYYDVVRGLVGIVALVALPVTYRRVWSAARHRWRGSAWVCRWWPPEDTS